MNLAEFYHQYEIASNLYARNYSWLFDNDSMAKFKSDETQFYKQLSAIVGSLKQLYFGSHSKVGTNLQQLNSEGVYEKIDNLTQISSNMWSWMHVFYINDAIIKWKSMPELQNRSIHIVIYENIMMENLMTQSMDELGFIDKLRRYKVFRIDGKLGVFQDSYNPYIWWNDIVKLHDGHSGFFWRACNVFGTLFAVHTLVFAFYILIVKYVKG